MVTRVKGLSPILWNKEQIYHQLFYWVLIFIISDFIYLGFVSASYMAYKSHLYKYAHLKFIICTIILVFNFCFLGYGGYIIS